MELRITTLLASGDSRAAFELMADAWAADLGRFCSAMVGSEAEAEELLQEALVEAFCALERQVITGSVRGWLFGVTRRVCSQHLRKRDRRRSLVARWFSIGEEPAAAPATDPVELSQTRAALSAALAGLKPRLREAVLMRYQAGLGGAEIARALGISHAAARKRVSLGLSALRSELRPILMLENTDEHERTLHAPVESRLGLT